MTNSDPRSGASGDDKLNEFAEIAVGAAILGLRKVNTTRRDFVKRVPQVAPAVDAVLGYIDELAEPAADAVGAVITAVGDSIGGTNGARVADVGRTLAELGPQLIKMSGLTHRG